MALNGLGPRFPQLEPDAQKIDILPYRRDKSNLTKYVSQLKEMEFDQVVLIAKEPEAKEHKINRTILALNSTYFKQMFNRGENLQQNQRILLETSCAHLDILVNFFKTDSISFPTSTFNEFALDLKNLGVTELYQHVLQWLRKTAKASNCMALLELGQQLDEDVLSSAAMKIINKDFTDESLKKQILQTASRDCMLQILKSDDLEVQSERELFDFTSEWLRSRDYTAQTPGTFELLSSIRYVHFDFAFLTFEARKSQFIDSRMDSVLLDAIAFIHAPFGSVCDQSNGQYRCRKGHSACDGILAVDYESSDTSKERRQLQFFNPTTKKWVAMAKLPEKIDISFVTVYQENIVVIPKKLPGVLHFYDIFNKNWFEADLSLPDNLELEQPTVVVVNERQGLIIVGGQRSEKVSVFNAKLIGSTFAVEKLCDLPEFMFVPRVVVLEGKTYIYGGYTKQNNENLSMCVLSENLEEIKMLKPVPKKAIALAAPRASGGKLYTLIENDGELWEFDVRKEDWRLLRNVDKTTFNHNVSFTVHDNCLFFLGTVQRDVESFFSLDLISGQRQEYNCCIGAGKKYLKSVRLRMPRS